jgi:hypothetical protein
MQSPLCSRVPLELALRSLVLCSITAACTGGFITRQNGNQWTPSGDGSPLTSGVVTFSGSGGTYQVWTKPGSGVTEFSFDPYASSIYTGNYNTNDNVIIPPGTYTVTVADNYVWQANNVTVNDGQACPYSDEYTGQSNIDCQLFQFELMNCGVTPSPPYQSGNLTIVELAQLNSGQCGARSCSHDVKDVSGSFFTNPVITEIYASCSLDPPAGCTQSPNTGMWSSLSNSTAFWSRMVEYGAGSGSYGGSYELNQFLIPQIVTDSYVEELLPAAIQEGYVKSPFSYLSYANPAVFVLYLPSTGCAGQCDGTSHHFSFLGSDGQLYNVAIIAGYSSAQTQNAVAGHEVAEAVTDVNDYNPGCGTNTGCGWNEPSTNEGEIADLCSGNAPDTINGFNVAQLWSQAQCKCL